MKVQPTADSTTGDRLIRWGTGVVVVLATVLVCFYRRPDQLFNPYIWVEDTINLSVFSQAGWSSIFYPLVGYFILPAKLIFALAASLSFRWLPEISYGLTIVFTAAVVAAIALSPTQLKNRLACALAVLLLPIDSEVFGVSLYTGWWGSILAVLPLLWRNDGPQRLWLRLGLLTLGGLSSPLIVGLVPLYALRAALLKRTAASFDLIVSLAIAIVQMAALIKTAVRPDLAQFNLDAWMVLEKYLGYFLYAPREYPHSTTVPFWLGIALALFIGVCWFIYRTRLGLPYLLLCGCLIVSIAMTVVRVQLGLLHPGLNGPRYFFLPFVFLAWMIVQLASVTPAIPRVVAFVLLAIAFRNSFDFAQRRHETIDWRAEVTNCMAQPGEIYVLRFHYDGKIKSTGVMHMKPGDCRRLVSESWFGRN